MTGHFLQGYISTHIGWSGVDLFFVLSGFFVSGILFREYQQKGFIKPKRFLIRRGLKIWPLFYTALIIQLIYQLSKGLYPGTKNILIEFFFLQDYFEGFMKVTWSLGIEEQFYLILALTTPFILKKFGIKHIITVCIVVMIFCLMIRIINLSMNPGYDPYKHFFPLHLRADALCSGIIVSWFYHFKKEIFINWVVKNKIQLWLAIVILLWPLFVYSLFDKFILTIGFSMIYLGYAVLVALLLALPMELNKWRIIFEKNLILKGIAWIGFYSYAIYLFHFFVGFGAVSNFNRLIWPDSPISVQLVVFVGSDIIFGWLISRLIEQPVLRWRNRIFPA